MERISFLDAYWLLERQTGGVLPPETLDASWFSNDSGHMLAAIVRDACDHTWRYFIFKRAKRDAPYARIAAGEDIRGFAAARVAMERDAAFDQMRRPARRNWPWPAVKEALAMELPATVVCDVCGVEAPVPRQSIDEDAATGQLRGFDQTWREGFLLTIECSNCGRRKQRLTLRTSHDSG